ncbi:MAG: YfiR family protein [Nitrospinota bacterium]|nr:YfiR family protein [Nitrospinota bacterium]
MHQNVIAALLTFARFSMRAKWVARSVFGMAFLPTVAMGWADGMSQQESAIKAGFIYNFAKFVSWPRSATSSGVFVFCVGGDKEFSMIFRKTVAGKKISELPIDVVDIEEGDLAKPCNVLYIPHTEPEVAEKFLDGYPGHPVLSVGETSDFIAKGGVIGFYLDSGRLRFEIGLSNANKSELTISSELLSLAKVHR